MTKEAYATRQPLEVMTYLTNPNLFSFALIVTWSVRALSSSLDPQKYSRIRLFGKRVRNIDLARFIIQELEKNTKLELCKKMSMTYPTLQGLVNLAEKEGITTGKKEVKYEEKWTGAQKEFLNIDEITTWRQYMDRKARGGKAFSEKAKRLYLGSLYQMCDTLSIHPKQIIYGNSVLEVLESGRKIMAEFFAQWEAGTAKVKYTPAFKAGTINKTAAAYRYSKALRDFMKSAGYDYPAGESGLMSQSITSFHGHYSTVRISEEIHRAIQTDLVKEYGIESDEWLYYSYGIEAFPRASSLVNTRSQYEEIQEGNHIIMITKNYEAKTSHYKKGIWTKYIFDPNIQAQIKRREKTQEYLFTDRSQNFQSRMNEMLRTEYRKYGLDKLAHRIEGDNETSYFIVKPNHTLRHAGAQRLLRATNWNVAFVASLGWKKTQELIDSYGEMPPELKARTLGAVEF